MTLWQSILMTLTLLTCATPAFALPDLSKTIQLSDARVIGDRHNENTYYLVPQGVEVLPQADGGPHLSLSLMQYVGTNAREDVGRFEIFSSFRIRVRLKRHTADQRTSIEARLRQQLNKSVNLEDLTVDQITAHLVSSVGGESPIAQSWQFDETTKVSNTNHGAAWSERDLVMSFAADEAELLERLLRQQDAGLSLAYTISSKAWRVAESEIEGNINELVVGSSGTTATSSGVSMDDLLDEELVVQAAELEAIIADALPIRVPGEYIESRIKRFVLDGSLPASYPSLAVYYFDMRNGNADGIFLRHVEIEATGVGGGNTRYSAFFEATRPQDYAVTVRFPYAVNLREPYRWRAIDVLLTGEMRIGPWTTGDNWSTVINASGPLPSEPAKPNLGEES